MTFDEWDREYHARRGYLRSCGTEKSEYELRRDAFEAGRLSLALGPKALRQECDSWDAASAEAWELTANRKPLPPSAKVALDRMKQGDEKEQRETFAVLEKVSECDCGGPPGHVPGGVSCRRLD